MEYMSERKLVEGENEQGYWVKGSRVWSVTESRHVEFMMEHPDYFDLTTDEIGAMFKANNETIEKDAKTREQLIMYACNLGWIRIRHYVPPLGFWSIQCDNIKTREHNIRDFIEDFAFKNKLMGYEDKITIIGLNSNDDMDNYPSSAGGAMAFLRKVSMEEGSEIKLNDIINEYKM